MAMIAGLETRAHSRGWEDLVGGLGVYRELLGNRPLVRLLVGEAICATCGSAFFYPAIGAYIPALAKDERQLGPANSAWATIQNFSYIVGPAIGGVVLALGSVTTAFVLNAISFSVIVVILWRLPP